MAAALPVNAAVNVLAAPPAVTVFDTGLTVSGPAGLMVMVA
jgi:hypothetical protein